MSKKCRKKKQKLTVGPLIDRIIADVEENRFAQSRSKVVLKKSLYLGKVTLWVMV